jgi:2-pyrone-4,6-dicarboxylate lactonase
MTMTEARAQHTRRPRFKLPAGSCDTHCHVFGPAAVFPYAAGRKYTPADSPKEALAALHARLGVERAVIVQASPHGTDNRAMLDAIAHRPAEYRGVGIVDGSFTDQDLEALHRGGVRGARFNFTRHLGGHSDWAVVYKVADQTKGLGWHVVLHVDPQDIIALSEMIRKLPLPFVVDHMGKVPASAGVEQPPLRALLELARLERCWIKVCGSERISAPPYDAARPIARVIVEAIPDRVLWGTDFPHPNLNHDVDEADLVDLVPGFAVTEAEQRKLLVDNPARLYGFGPA